MAGLELPTRININTPRFLLSLRMLPEHSSKAQVNTRKVPYSNPLVKKWGLLVCYHFTVAVAIYGFH